MKKYLLFLSMVCIVCFGTIGYGSVVHRYSFEVDTSDSIGDAHGALISNTGNSVFVDGELVLGNTDGMSSNANNGDYVDLPNGIISDLGQDATFETWVIWNGPAESNWQRIFDFGTSDEGEDKSPGGNNTYYIFATPRNGGTGTLRFGYKRGLPEVVEEIVIDGPTILAQGIEKHIVVVWDGENQTASLYEDGVFMSEGTTHFALGDIPDINNWLGRAQWNDPMFVGSFIEFRIYDSALTDGEVAASFGAGPDAEILAVQSVNPIPAKHATDVLIDSTLSWEKPYDIDPVAYDVLIGNDPNAGLEIVSWGQQGTSLDLSTLSNELAPSTQYFWRVDAHDPNDGDTVIRPGRMWDFTTKAIIPIVVSEPANAIVHPGETATFTFDVSSTTEVTYSWFIVGDDDEVLSSSNVLDITDAQLGDEGDYYCIAENEAGPTVSAIATLTIKQMLAHYKLDDAPTEGDPNVIDSSGYGHHGTAVGNVSATEGIIDGALAFGGVNGDRVLLGTWNPSEVTGQVSVSHWINWSGSGGSWQATVAKKDGWAWDNEMWQLELTTNSNPKGYLDWKREGSYPWPGLTVPVGEWIHVGASFDGTDVTLYLNGESVGTAGFSFGTKMDAMLSLGDGDNTTAYMGNIDDVRIYNYALSPVEMAIVYTDGPGETACLQTPQFDYNGDCMVNVGDLAIFAADWLECNAVPQCLP